MAPSGVAQRDRLRHLATRTELAGFPSVLRGQRSSERARPSWKPGAFRGVTEPAGEAPTGRLHCKDGRALRDPAQSSPRPDVECCPTPVVVLKQPTPPQCIPFGGCRRLRVLIFGCCGFSCPAAPSGAACGRARTEPSGTDVKAQAPRLSSEGHSFGRQALPAAVFRDEQCGFLRELRRQCRTRSRQEQAQGSIGRTCVATRTLRNGLSGC